MNQRLNFLKLEDNTLLQKTLKPLTFQQMCIRDRYHYIDELSYSRMYFQYGFEKGRGVVRIKRELSEKGVDSHVIEAAYDELEDVPDQFETASEIAAGMTAGVDWEQMGYEDVRRLQAKIGRRLMTRGFSSDIVYKVINRLK